MIGIARKVAERKARREFRNLLMGLLTNGASGGAVFRYETGSEHHREDRWAMWVRDRKTGQIGVVGCEGDEKFAADGFASVELAEVMAQRVATFGSTAFSAGGAS